MKQIAFMFPGQGSQKVGMGIDFFRTSTEVENLFRNADLILNKDMTKLILEGPADELTKTENAQPALLLLSVAINNLLIKEGIKPHMVVGHSLGEYSALVAAEVLTIDQALPLVTERGKLMEKAVPKGQGSMAAVLGLDAQTIHQTINRLTSHEIVDIANINCPGQIVISGTKEGLKQVEPLLKEAGARRVISLNVSGPFHSRLMRSASEKFAKILHNITFQDATFPVYANVTASPVTSSEKIKELLIKQLYSPVQFEESIQQMIQSGVNTFVEVGNGKVLTGLVKKINRKVDVFHVQDPDSLMKFIEWHKEESRC